MLPETTKEDQSIKKKVQLFLSHYNFYYYIWTIIIFQPSILNGDFIILMTFYEQCFYFLWGRYPHIIIHPYHGCLLCIPIYIIEN